MLGDLGIPDQQAGRVVFRRDLDLRRVDVLALVDGDGTARVKTAAAGQIDGVGRLHEITRRVKGPRLVEYACLAFVGVEEVSDAKRLRV